MLSSGQLASRYTLFATMATSANIGTQDLILRVYSGNLDLMISIIAGTVAGLLIKYFLDKHYIFFFQPRSVAHDGQTFIFYCAMGLVTTSIFWGFELGFNHLFETKELRYLGGILGLTIGYVSKYNLDKHYVFQMEAR